ncbi:MAG TPA: protein kinase, partial [Planctomycetaceae bacterium]|nr:protein kinase [Planctomycetaceae bacterium]
MSDQSKQTQSKVPRVEAALRDYRERIDRGESVNREEFISRHAEIADALRSSIASEEELRKPVGAEDPRESTGVSTRSFAARGEETFVPHAREQRAAKTEGLSGEFGRYHILRALGSGAMGTVYLAEDTQLERQVAIKTPHFTESRTEESLERFYREARVAATLRQPNICPVFDIGQIGGKHYISMAYIEGLPLSAFIEPDKAQTERQILIVIHKLAIALQEAHDHGIVHRDLKPANIMVDKKGEPIIMDFGLAHQVRRNEDVRLTQTGNILGTPAYMSPEQVEGEPDKIGPATDQYSLGVILYELLTAQLPFCGSVIAVMGQILTKEPPRPRDLRPDLDSRIEAACLKMMAKRPSERFASLKEVADELTAILESPASKPTSDTARIGVLDQFRRPLNDGGWIPWSVLAFGLTVFGVMAANVAFYPGRKAVVIDIKDRGVEGGKTALPPLTPNQKETTTATLPPTFKNNLGMEFVLVPKGKSWLGGGGGRPGDQEVVVAHDFYLGKYEVTQEEWEKVNGLT